MIVDSFGILAIIEREPGYDIAGSADGSAGVC
jgi:hypothetical protein